MAIDPTVRIFNEYYNLDLRVSANEYDIVQSFFTGYTSDRQVAANFTETLFRISNETGIDVLTLLDSFQGTDSMKITLTMAYYLNSFSDKTVMFGVNEIITANQAVERNIVQ
jgi:hypothetical protein